MKKTAALIVAGGTGQRMNTSLPKQYLLLNGKTIARYSFELFLTMNVFDEIVVVCDPLYQSYFAADHLRLHFALPGERRQDSVYHGLQKISKDIEYVCIHDSARPLINEKIVLTVLEEAYEHGAAVAAMPVKFTIKQGNVGQFVSHTLDRSHLFEIQTPQIMRKDYLEKGFDLAHSKNLTVTDDVSLVELMGEKVKLVEGSYSNIKITTQEDLAIAEVLVKKPPCEQ